MTKAEKKRGNGKSDEMEEERLTMIPNQLQIVQSPTLLVYLIFPFESKGQTTLVINAGKMLNRATTPLGVSADTRSNAADKMIT